MSIIRSHRSFAHRGRIELLRHPQPTLGQTQRGPAARRAPRRHALLAAASAASVVALLIIAAAALGATGDLTQKAPTDGCIVEDDTVVGVTTCADGVALSGATSVTVSPDGASAYVASQFSDAVAVFDRQAAPETAIDSEPTATTDDNTPTLTFRTLSSTSAGLPSRSGTTCLTRSS